MKISALQSARGGWCILAADQPAALAERTATPDLPGLYRHLMTQWTPLVSGVIVEPEYGLPLLPLKAKKVGVAIRLESTQESDPFGPPSIASDWGIEEISANYGVVKIGLAYHPSEPNAAVKKQSLAEFADYARYQNCEVLLDLKLLELPATAVATSPAEALIEAVQELRDFCQLLVVSQVPDALTAATVTAELDGPWLLRLDQPEYQTAKDELRQSLEAGASGCVVGSSIWSGLASKPTPNQLDVFLQSEARDRLIELKRIVDERAVG